MHGLCNRDPPVQHLAVFFAHIDKFRLAIHVAHEFCTSAKHVCRFAIVAEHMLLLLFAWLARSARIRYYFGVHIYFYIIIFV